MSEKKISLLNEKSLLATRIKAVLSAMKNYSRHLQARIDLRK